MHPQSPPSAHFLFLLQVFLIYTRTQTEVFIGAIKIIVVSYIKPFNLEHTACIGLRLFLSFTFQFLSHDLLCQISKYLSNILPRPRACTVMQ